MSPVEGGSVYRGPVEMWAMLLHRVSGLVLVGWVIALAVERSTVVLGAEFHDRFRDVITTGPFRLLEVAVLAAAVFHGLNGFRLITIDLVPRAAARRHDLMRAQIGLFFALFVPTAWVVLARFLDIG